MCADIVAKLQGSGASSNVVSSIVCDLEELVTEIHSEIQHRVLSAFPVNDSLKSEVEHSLNDFENPFASSSTDSKRNSYFTEKWGIVEPVEIVFGYIYIHSCFREFEIHVQKLRDL